MALCQILTLFFYILYILHPNIKRSTLSKYSYSLRLYTNIMFKVTLNYVFKVKWKWKSVKVWAYLCKIFYVLHPNANEMFQKKLRLFPAAVEVCGDKVGYCSNRSGVLRFHLILIPTRPISGCHCALGLYLKNSFLFNSALGLYKKN